MARHSLARIIAGGREVKPSGARNEVMAEPSRTPCSRGRSVRAFLDRPVDSARRSPKSWRPPAARPRAAICSPGMSTSSPARRWPSSRRASAPASPRSGRGGTEFTVYPPALGEPWRSRRFARRGALRRDRNPARGPAGAARPVRPQFRPVRSAGRPVLLDRRELRPAAMGASGHVHADCHAARRSAASPPARRRPGRWSTRASATFSTCRRSGSSIAAWRSAMPTRAHPINGWRTEREPVDELRDVPRILRSTPAPPAFRRRAGRARPGSSSRRRISAGRRRP